MDYAGCNLMPGPPNEWRVLYWIQKISIYIQSLFFSGFFKIVRKSEKSIPRDVKWSQDLQESDESCSGSRKWWFIPDFQFYLKKYFGHKPALEKWSRGATALEMTGSTRSTTLVLTIFFDFFDPRGPGGVSQGSSQGSSSQGSSQGSRRNSFNKIL